MAIPSDSEVKTWVHSSVIELFRQLALTQGALKSAESAYGAQAFIDITSALDEANDQLTIAVNAG